MNADIQWWAKHCLLCLKVANGKVIPRPLGYQLRATQPMEVITLDFLDMPASAKQWGYKSLLVIVDQLTRICIIVPTKDKTALTAATILLEATMVVVLPRPGVYNIGRGNAFQEYPFQKLGKHSRVSTPYHGTV